MLESIGVRKLIALSLEEDLAFGDITTELTVDAQRQAKASVIAREPLVACGLPLVQQIVAEAKYSVVVTVLVQEGQEVLPSTSMCELKGTAREILALERTILNFLQRMSGVASYTREFVKQASGIIVLDTRKTMPGWRILDKYATRVGGAKNHRASLGDMILVKNNHVDAAKGNSAAERMQNTLQRIWQEKPLYMPIEIEVRSHEELEVALSFKPTVVMLDNMSDDQIKHSMALVQTKAPTTQVEVSGGITGARSKALQALGVSCVSVGSLTTKAPNKDISLRIQM